MADYRSGTRGNAIAILESGGGSYASQTVIGTIPGVIVTGAAGLCGTGIGYLRSTGDGSWLSFKAPGSDVWGEPTHVTESGGWLLEDGEDAKKWLALSVFVGHLLPGPTEAQIVIVDAYENSVSGADVTAAEAAAGDVVDREVSVGNFSDCTIYDVRIWLNPSADGSSYLELSADGVDWYAPTSEDDPDVIDLGDIVSFGSAPLHIRRTIPSAEPANQGLLAYICGSWNGY